MSVLIEDREFEIISDASLDTELSEQSRIPTYTRNLKRNDRTFRVIYQSDGVEWTVLSLTVNSKV